MGKFSETELKNRTPDELKTYYIRKKFELSNCPDQRSKEGQWALRCMRLVKAEILRRNLNPKDVLGDVDEAVDTKPKISDYVSPLLTQDLQSQTTTSKPTIICLEWSLKDAYILMQEFEELEKTLPEGIGEDSMLERLNVELRERFKKTLGEL